MADVFPEVGQVVLTSLLSLAAMFIFTRAGGKRQIAQMSPFDYLNAVTVGSIGAELATNLEQWWRPFSALVVYGLVTWFVHYTACKSNAMRSLWSGRSLILMDDVVAAVDRLAAQQGTVVLDLRSREAYDAGHYKGAQWLGPDVTAEKLAALAPNKASTLLFYCTNSLYPTRMISLTDVALPQAAALGYANVFKLDRLWDAGGHVDAAHTALFEEK